MKKPPKVSHIVWVDAGYSPPSGGETPFKDMALANLHEVGFIVAETSEFVALSLEWRPDMDSARNWLCIPKQGIIERHDFAIPKTRANRVRSASQEGQSDVPVVRDGD